MVPARGAGRMKRMTNESHLKILQPDLAGADTIWGFNLSNLLTAARG